jgi:hypothetical protein
LHTLIDSLESSYQDKVNASDEEYNESDPNYQNLFKTKVMRHYVNLFFANEESIHYTNITGAVAATSRGDAINFVPNDLYTTISPHFLRGAISYIIQEKQNFFDSLTSKFISSYSVSDVRQTLLDNDFEATRLGHVILPPILSIKQDGHQIIISLDIPATLSTLVRKHFEEFSNSLQSLEGLIEEVGGKLNVSHDEEQLIASISCPEQDLPPYDPDEIINENDIYPFCIGKAPIGATSELPPLELRRDYDKEYPDTKLKIRISQNCITMEDARKAMASALLLASEVDTNRSIDELIISRDGSLGLCASFKYRSSYIGEINPFSLSHASLLVNPLFLDEKSIHCLSSLTKVAKCKELQLIGSTEEDVGMQILSIAEALLKSRNVSKEPYSLEYKFPDSNSEPLLGILNQNDGLSLFASYDKERGILVARPNLPPCVLSIRDNDGNLLLKARYNNAKKRLEGRFHHPELTLKVSEIFNNVFDIETLTTQEPHLDIKDPFFTKALDERFEAHNVVLTDGYTGLVHKLALSCTHIYIVRNILNSELFNGIMSIKQVEDKFILDAPETNNDDPFYSAMVIEP